MKNITSVNVIIHLAVLYLRHSKNKGFVEKLDNSMGKEECGCNGICVGSGMFYLGDDDRKSDILWIIVD